MTNDDKAKRSSRYTPPESDTNKQANKQTGPEVFSATVRVGAGGKIGGSVKTTNVPDQPLKVTAEADIDSAEADVLFKKAIRQLVAGQDLDRNLSHQLGRVVLQGRSISAQIAGVLVGLATKGESPQEILGMRDAMLEAAIELDAPSNAIDIVGIGGSKRRRKRAFNVSTMASIIASAAGATVAKHGNRKATSTSGSFDLLEALGVKIGVEPAVVEDCIAKIGLGFAYAPSHHPAMRYAGSTRAELAIPTIFNLVGPLTNPAGVKRQLLGVSSPQRVDTLAQTLIEMDMERVWLVVGDGELDEATIWGRTEVTVIEGKNTSRFSFTPEDAGLTSAGEDQVGGGSAQDNAAIALSIIEGEPSANCDMVLLNAGCALCVAGVAESIAEGVELCREAVATGKARAQLKALIAITNDV